MLKLFRDTRSHEHTQSHSLARAHSITLPRTRPDDQDDEATKEVNLGIRKLAEREWQDIINVGAAMHGPTRMRELRLEASIDMLAYIIYIIYNI